MSHLSHFRTIPTEFLAAFVSLQKHHGAARHALSLDLAHRLLPQQFNALVIRKERGDSEMPIAYVTGDPRVVPHARWTGGTAVARRVARVTLSASASLISRGTQRPSRHGSRQIRYNLIMLIIQ